ncbi:MAG: flippase-like domain-containing protein, partial [Anaerolineales bacterium]|nr:flippase-like domain-containing protein [Anaerolineales bacterium]
HNKIKQVMITLMDTETQVSSFCRDHVLALMAVAILSVGIWALMVFEFGMMMQFLGVQFNLVQVLIALTAARIAFLLPFPAGLGALEAGQVMAMGLIGVSPAIGIGLSLLIRARDVLFGGVGLWLGGLYNK